MWSINKNKMILIGILILAFLLRFHNLGYAEFTGDEAIVVAKSLGIVRAGSYFRKTPFLDKEVNFWTLNIILKHHHPPMEITAHIPLLVFFGVTEFVARIPYLFSGVISVLLFYKIAEELYGTTTAHLAATFASINGYFIAFSRHVQFMSLFLLFSLLTAYYSVKYYKSNDLKDSGLAAFFLGLTLLSHHFGIFMVIPLLYIIVKKWYENSLETKNLVVSLTILAILILPFFIPWMFASYFFPELIPPGTGYASTSQRASPSLYFNFFIFRIWLRYNPLFFSVILICGTLISLWFRNWKLYFFVTWFLAYFIPLIFLLLPSPTYTYVLLAPLILLASFGIHKSYFMVTDRIRKVRIKTVNVFVILAGLCFLSLSVWNSYITFLQYDIYPASAPLFYNSRSYKTEQDAPYGANYGRKIGYKAAGWFIRHNSNENDVILGDDPAKAAYYCDRLIKGDIKHPEDFETIKRELPKNLFILFPSHLIDQYTEIWTFTGENYNLVAVVSYDGQSTMFIFGPSPSSEVTELSIEKYEKLFDEEFGSVENSLYKYFGGSYPTTMV